MDTHTQKKVLGSIILVMLVILLCLCAILVTGARRSGIVHSTTLRTLLTAQRTKGPLPFSDTNLIRPWMTFDYINQLFALPSDYLKITLNIQDSRYPNLSLSEYRESIATSSDAFLDTVRTAILDSTTTRQ